MPAASIEIARTFSQRIRWALPLLLAVAAVAHAQDLPEAPAPLTVPVQSIGPAASTAPAKRPPTLYDDLEGRTGLVCGAGASTSSVDTKPTTQCGAYLALGYMELEVGVMGPQASHSDVSGYLSVNTWIPLSLKSTSGTPVAVGGYTRMFETGHAVDYGVGYITRVGPPQAARFLQFDVRDYCAFANPTQHNVIFRITWVHGIGGLE